MASGAVQTDLGPITQTDFGFTGQRNISSLGLYDYHARMYDPAIGRFIQPDSIVPKAANPQALNRYSYVFNQPINLIDPIGHDPWWCTSSSCENDYNNSDERIVYLGSFTAGLNPQTLGENAEETYTGGIGTTKSVKGVAPEVPILPGQKSPELWDPSGPAILMNDAASSHAPANSHNDVYIYLSYTKIKEGLTINTLYIYNNSSYKIYLSSVSFLAKDVNGKEIQAYTYLPEATIGSNSGSWIAIIKAQSNMEISLGGTKVNPSNKFNNSTVDIRITFFDPSAAFHYPNLKGLLIAR